MPLGLRFFPTPKKAKKVGAEDGPGGKNDGIELKSMSDPLLNVSSVSNSEISLKSESVGGLPDVTSPTGNNSGGSFDCMGVGDGVPSPAQDEGINPLEIPEMIGSFFDRNGNEVEEEPPPPPEPKCFINAAALLDEEPEYVPSPPPSLIPPEGVTGKVTKGKLHVSPHSSGIPVRRRVPISKSFPDIIQTTILKSDAGFESNQMGTQGKGKETTGNPIMTMVDSLIVADSLEEIQVQNFQQEEPESSPVGEGNGKLFDRIEPGMMESVTSGITSEKPPETWTVDFNSFTSEIEGEESLRQRRKSTSSTNSLAYFINIDEVDSDVKESQGKKDDLTSSTDSKKIFSMFVDIGAKESQSGSSKLKPDPPLPPVKNRGYGGGGDSNLRLKALHSGIPRFPGPHLQSKGSKTGNSMSSSMMMSSVSDVETEFPGISSNRSSLHVANHEHDGSFTSSILSSMEMSVLEDPDVCIGGPCFKLGMDLLRMFQEGVNTDVNISVHGRYVKAHKCILASRSQYFAAILSGNWIQKAGNTIHLDEFSYNTVQFTMYHIYSGTNEIPDTIDLMELATLTDMLGLEGLREVISQTIRTRFCHNFHRPCTGCIGGILEFFPLAVSYGMDDLQRKMTKWICKHFVRIWPTKAFANLGDSLIEKCLRFSVSHLSPENLLDVTLGCDQLMSTMPTVRWTEAIFSIVNQLSEACIQYVGQNLSEVLQSQRFMLFGKGQTWNISRIENTFLEGISLLKPDEACLSHVALCRLLELGTMTIDEVEWSTIFVDFLKMLRKEVEKYLLENASKAVLSKNWELLSQDVRKRICSTGFLGSDKSGAKGLKTGTKSGGANAGSTKSQRPTSSVSNSGQSQGSTNTNRARISPQQTKPAEISRPAPNLGNTEETRSASPFPSSETTQKVVSTKSVASVRPMQSQPQTPVTPTTVVNTPNVYSTGKTTVAGTSRSNPTPRVSSAGKNKGTKPAPPTPTTGKGTEPHHRRQTASTLEKERSFDTSSRVSSAGSGTNLSARRGSISSRTTPTNAVTPNTPSNKPFNKFTSKASTVRKPVPEPEPLPVPKPTFMTNSEKAKAVSKPKLIFRNQRSNSVSTEGPPSPLPPMNQEIKSHSRQSSVGSMSQTGQRTPNLVQASRYSSKPKTNSEKTIKPPPLSPMPRSRFGNTPRSAPATATGTRFQNQVRSNQTRNVRGKNEEETPRRRKKGMDLSGSIQMSKSSIETELSDGSESKVRTLAEIGRSNTFSKDEPTIIGKLDMHLGSEM